MNLLAWALQPLLAGVALAFVAPISPAIGSAWPQPLPACAGLTPSDQTRIAHGAVIGRTLPGTSAYEVVVAGGVRIHVSADAYVAAYRDIVPFKKQSDHVLEIGMFSDPPRLSDVSSLTLDDADVDAMRRCRIGRCDVKLPSRVISQLPAAVEWSTPLARAQATELMQQTLLDYVTAYRAGGDRALGEYDDKEHPVRIADEFQSLLQGAACLSAIAPELHRYLMEYPQGQLPGAEEFFYWSKETFGMKPFISITQVVIHRPAPGLVAMVSKGIYSDHYLEASLSLVLIHDASAADGPAIDLVYVNRSRADALRSSMAFLARGIIARRQRDGVIRELRALRTRMEQPGAVR